MAEKKKATEKQDTEHEETEYLSEEKKQEFLSFLDEQVKNHPVVKEYHGKWKELIEWCDYGNQYCEYDQGKMVDIRPLLRKRKRTIVVNLMKPLSEAIDSKLNTTYSLVGTPNSSEMEDVEASKVATKISSHLDYVSDIDTLFEDFKYDLVRTGNAWIKWVWDTAGQGFIKKENGDGTESVKEDGEIMGYVPSVFNVRQDPTATRREDMRWLIELAEVNEDEILENFPKVTKEELRAEATSSTSANKYEGMNEKLEDKAEDEKTYIVKYYWEKKNKKFPKGRLIIATNNVVLYKGPNPALGEIPYFHCFFKRYANSFYGTGLLHHVQDLQRAYNRMASLRMEHIEGWRAKMIVPSGSILKEGSFTTDSFELLEVDTTKGEPHPASMPELSPQVSAYQDFLAGAFNTVSNVHEVSYSQLPQYSSRAPASLYSMMLEQENLKIDPLIKRLNKMILDMGKYRLRLADRYYTQPRLVKVVGKGKESSIEYFKGADLKGNFDVKLEIGVSLQQSSIIQQRLLLELKQNGIITDNDKILKLLNLGQIEEELRGDIADETRAIRENQAFINDSYKKPIDKGGVYVYKHDNHMIHMDYHTNLAKNEETQRWAMEKRAAFEAHIEEHFAYVQMLQAQTAIAGQAGGMGQTQPTLPGAETMAEGANVEPAVAEEREAITQ